MKKNTKAMLLTATMMMGLATSVSAAGSSEIVKEGGVEVPLVGEIADKASLLSVVMPTSIDFVVGTENTSDAILKTAKNPSASDVVSGGGPIFSAFYQGNATVTNNSEEKKIKLELVELKDTQGLLDLMNLTISTDQMSSAEQLKSGKNYANSPIVLATSLEGKATGGTTGASLSLQLGGSALTGSYDGDTYQVQLPAGTYTINTTMKISKVS